MLFRVRSYDPIFQRCDLDNFSQSQAGTKFAVPIGQLHGGVGLRNQKDYSAWGAASAQVEGVTIDGPRWGVALPIQVGDIAQVELIDGEDTIVCFFRQRGEAGPAVVALGLADSLYRQSIPPEDLLAADRFDVLLPTGAWARANAAGGWTIATAPVDNPRAFAVLFPNGSVRVWGRTNSPDDYNLRLDMNPDGELFTLQTLSGNSVTATISIEANTGRISIVNEADVVLRSPQDFKIEVGGKVEIDCGQESTINSRAIAVIGARDNDGEANGPDVLVTSGQF